MIHSSLRKLTLAATATVALAFGQAAMAVPTQWAVEDGGNGHWYMPVIVAEGIGWEDARIAAEDLGGHLVTITSAEENDFVFSLVNSPSYFNTDATGRSQFGPWLGAARPEHVTDPSEGWEWVTGPSLDTTYTNWFGGEPNNFMSLNERYLQFYGLDELGSRWNDMMADWLAAAYIVEFTQYDPVTHLAHTPEPTTAALGVIALAAAGSFIGSRRARRREV